MSQSIRLRQIVLTLLALAALWFALDVLSDLIFLMQSSGRRVVNQFPSGASSSEEALIKEKVTNVDNYFRTLPKACLNDRTFQTNLREYVLVKIFQETIQPYEFQEADLETLKRRCKGTTWSDIEKIIDQHLESVKGWIRKLDRDQFLKWFMEQFDWFIP